MADRIVANTLEQATSSDFNAAQQMQARRVDDITIGFSGVPHIQVPADSFISMSNSNDTQQSVVTGLHCIYPGNMDGIDIAAGTLTQNGVDWLSADPSTTKVTGIQRTTVNVPYVSTAAKGFASDAKNAYHLLCAKVVDVISVTSTVKIFDVPTQVFVLTAMTKRVETRIQYKWVLGDAYTSDISVFPALDSGDPTWEPIAYVSFVYPGGTENRARVIDVARRPQLQAPGMVNATYGTSNNQVALPASFQGSLESGRSPLSGTATARPSLRGAGSGSINGEYVFFGCSLEDRQASVIDATDNYSVSSSEKLVHFYLCPMVIGSAFTAILRWPTKMVALPSQSTQSQVQRGLLVASSVQPTRRRTNGSAITLYEVGGARGRWAAQAAIPAGCALYVGSGHHATDSTTIGDLFPLVQSMGGITRYAAGDLWIDGSSVVHLDYRAPVALRITGAAQLSDPLSRETVFSLLGKIPNNATSVQLRYVVESDNIYTNININIRTASTLSRNVILASGTASNGAQPGNLFWPGNPISCEMTVPLFVAPSSHPDDANITDHLTYYQTLRLCESSSAENSELTPSIALFIVGWTI